ncbi:MAG: alpha/beta fold hydrolase [Caldilineaceae bacterium]
MLLQLNGAQLSYTTYGQGAPVLIMAGSSATTQCNWGSWLSGVATIGQLIAYAPAHTADQAQTPSAIDNEIDRQLMLAESLRRHLDYQSLFLFGHGYGGFLAQEYALRYGQHLAGVILCATMPALDYRDESANRLHRLTTPTLVVAGRLDWYTPPIQAERLHTALPASRLVIFDQSGHFPFATEPAKFSKVVSRWIAEQMQHQNGASQ